MSAPASTMAAPTSPPGRRGCGRRRRCRARSTSCSSTRPARSRSRTSSRCAARHRQPRPPRRPAAARPAAPWVASARGRPVGAGARPRRPRDDAADRWACSSRRPGGSTRTLCAFTSEVFYDDRLEPEPHLAGQRLVRPPTAIATARGPAAPGGRDDRRRQRIAGRGGRGRARLRAIDRRRRRGLGRPRTASARPIGWEDVLIVAPYNAQVGAIRRRLPPRGPGRHRRQVPGPGGADQHLLADDVVARSSRRAAWTSCTAATGSTSRHRGRAAWRSSSPHRTCSGSAPGRPSRCASPTRSAGSRSWPRPAD